MRVAKRYAARVSRLYTLLPGFGHLAPSGTPPYTDRSTHTLHGAMPMAHSAQAVEMEKTEIFVIAQLVLTPYLCM